MFFVETREYFLFHLEARRAKIGMPDQKLKYLDSVSTQLLLGRTCIYLITVDIYNAILLYKLNLILNIQWRFLINFLLRTKSCEPPELKVHKRLKPSANLTFVKFKQTIPLKPIH